MNIFKNTTLFKRRLVEKIICLIGAIVLFLYVSGEEENTVEYTVPIKIKNISEKLSVSRISSKQTTVILRGPSKSFSIVPLEIEAFIDATNAPEGQHKYNVVISGKMPKNIKYTFTPSYVDVMFEPVIAKRVPVKANITSKLPLGVVIDEYKIDPGYIEISGAKSIVDNISFLYTEPFELSQTNENFSLTLSVMSEDELKLGTDKINVHFSLTTDVAMKEFKSIEPDIYGLTENLYVKSKPKIKSVILEGVSADIEKLDLTNFSLILNLGGISTPGKYTNIQITENLPEYINMVSIEPKYLTVVIGEIKKK